MKRILKNVLLLILCVSLCGCMSKENNAQDIQTTQDTELEESENTSDESNETDDAALSEEKIQSDSSPEETNEEQTDEETVNEKKTDAEPVSNENSSKVIVIDPGHASHSNMEKEEQSPGSGIMKIKDGGGAQGNITGTPEYVVNMSVAMKLKSILESHNYTVVMTKTSHDVSLGNIERAEIGNNSNASLVIRIHCDSSDNASAHGASMLVPANTGYASAISDVSRKYGEIVLNSLVETAGMTNRGVCVRDDMTGFNWSKVPVILVEMGFMSNENEDRLLSDDSYQDKLAQGLFNGIEKCF